MKTRHDLIIGAALVWAQSLGITACAPEFETGADLSQVDESMISASDVSASDVSASDVSALDALASDDSGTARTAASLAGVTLDANDVVRVGVDGGTPTLSVHVEANVALVDLRASLVDSTSADGEVEVVWQDARNFDVVVRGSGLVKQALFGQALMLTFDAAGASHPLTAKLSMEPRLYGFRGRGPFAQAVMTPVFVGGTDPLRYRVLLDTRGASVEVNAAATVTPHPTKDTATVDLSFETISGLLDDGARIAFSTVFGTKTAQVGARVASLDLAVGSGAEVLQAEVCEAWVWQCLDRAEPQEISLCGTYLQVTRCLEADVCEVLGDEPFRLDPAEMPASIAEAQTDYAASATAPGFTWCQLTSLETYSVPECLASPATIQTIVAEIFAGSWQEPTDAFAYGREISAEDLSALDLFGAQCSATGPALLSAISAEFRGSQVVAWQYEEPTACHNCTSYRDLVVLFYPARGAVVVLEGGHGYDS
ncbi:MAG: hypothetical protein H6729_15935 [Deltaproteobacteria bacterium]|nr:hypothetical protein [Deltaproteobacteria bacterium]